VVGQALTLESVNSLGLPTLRFRSLVHAHARALMNVATIKLIVAKLLVVEDEPDLAQIIAENLRTEGHSVAVEHNGLKALEQAQTQAFDLLILDLMLPGLDGLEVARRLRKIGVSQTPPTVPILMLTARAEETDRVLGFEVGADDYIVKPFSLREFLARVRAMLRRAKIVEDEVKPEVLKFGRFELDSNARAVRIGEKLTDLTPREYELLLMLARHPGRTFTRDFLLERIWGSEFDGSDRVVDTTVVRLRRKLGAEGERVISVWGVGYRFDVL
jgi:DNA-binding response OmpR family regulator